MRDIKPWGEYTVIDMIDYFLEHNGFDGLYNDYCSCFIGDLCPCDLMPTDKEPDGPCLPGYKHNVNSVIKPEKP